MIEGALLYIRDMTGELWSRGSAKMLKGVKIYVTLFSYMVWLSAMKYGIARGLDNSRIS